MNKILWILFLFVTALLDARDNPFSPIEIKPPQKVQKPHFISNLDTPLESVSKEDTVAPTLDSITMPKKVQKPITSGTILKQKPVEIIKIIPAITKPIETNNTNTHISKVPKKATIKKIIPAKKVIATKKKIRKKKKKSTYSKVPFKMIYQNDNLKILLKNNYIKILTKDKIRHKLFLKHPNRLVLDFDNDFVMINTTRKPVHSRYVRQLKVGTHDPFYRTTFVLKKSKHATIQSKKYGYLIKLY